MKDRDYVLAIHSNVRSYGFVLFETEHSPFDWGIRDIRNRPRQVLIVDGAIRLMERYRPGVLVLEDYSASKTRAAEAFRRLSCALMSAAAMAGIDVRLYTREEIRRCFATVGATTKPEIAQAIACHIPAFGHRLPSPRRPGKGEDRRQPLFDAASVGLTHYCLSNEARLRNDSPDL